MVWGVKQIQSADLLQKQINSIFGEIEGAQPGYGSSLPSAVSQHNGRLFVNTTDGKLYQARGASWVALT